ncbi:hypothetical protein LTR17_025348, partial [Elasticomyces elasticus]
MTANRCSLLGLPAELRNHIFELALVSKNARVSIYLQGGHFTPPSATQPGISRTNRQLRQETLPIFYGQNAFEIHPSDRPGLLACKTWVQAIAAQLELIRTLVITPFSDHDVSIKLSIVDTEL